MFFVGIISKKIVITFSLSFLFFIFFFNIKTEIPLQIIYTDASSSKIPLTGVEGEGVSKSRLSLLLSLLSALPSPPSSSELGRKGYALPLPIT